MKEIYIDCTDIPDKYQLHHMIAEALGFPEWYGSNLDALYDCLTELEMPVRVTFSSLPDWAESFRQVFLDAAEENPELTVIF